jgi:hypothetical protein
MEIKDLGRRNNKIPKRRSFVGWLLIRIAGFSTVFIGMLIGKLCPRSKFLKEMILHGVAAFLGTWKYKSPNKNQDV